MINELESWACAIVSTASDSKPKALSGGQR
jgi:hypothetical protein